MVMMNGPCSYYRCLKRNNCFRRSLESDQKCSKNVTDDAFRFATRMFLYTRYVQPAVPTTSHPVIEYCWIDECVCVCVRFFFFLLFILVIDTLWYRVIAFKTVQKIVKTRQRKSYNLKSFYINYTCTHVPTRNVYEKLIHFYVSAVIVFRVLLPLTLRLMRHHVLKRNILLTLNKNR